MLKHFIRENTSSLPRSLASPSLLSLLSPAAAAATKLIPGSREFYIHRFLTHTRAHSCNLIPVVHLQEVRWGMGCMVRHHSPTLHPSIMCPPPAAEQDTHLSLAGPHSFQPRVHLISFILRDAFLKCVSVWVCAGNGESYWGKTAEIGELGGWVCDSGQATGYWHLSHDLSVYLWRPTQGAAQ